MKWSDIVCREVHDQRRESWDSKTGRLKIRTILECEWDNRYAVMEDLLTSGSGEYLPRAFPDLPTNQLIGVSSVRMQDTREAAGTDMDQQVNIPANVARLEVEYSRYWNVEETIEFDMETLPSNHENFGWKTEAFPGDSKRLKPKEAPAKPFYRFILVRKFVGLQAGSILLLDQLTGKTNSEEYRSTQLAGFIFKKETLLLLDPIVKPSMGIESAFTDNGFDVTLKFAYKPADGLGPIQQGNDSASGHNLFWRAQLPRAGNPDVKGFWDAMTIQAGSENQVDWKLYKPFPPDQALDNNWLQPAKQPVLAT